MATESNPATAGEEKCLVLGHVIQCRSKSSSLPVPPPLEGLNELLLSEQLKDPVRERDKSVGHIQVTSDHS